MFEKIENVQGWYYNFHQRLEWKKTEEATIGVVDNLSGYK